MIYTITLNPCLDYVFHFPKPLINHQKSNEAKLFPGGKGINASIMLNHLNVTNRAIVVTGGLIGKKLTNLLTKAQVDFINVNTEEETRINVKANAQGQTYEMNAIGVVSNDTNLTNDLIKMLESKIKDGDLVMIMGSLPANYDLEDLETIIKWLKKQGVRLIFDFDQLKLRKMVKYQPEIIKPNLAELAEIFNVKLETKNQIIKYGQKLLDEGAKRILISLGREGALYLDQENRYFIPGIKIEEVNGSGAGDSMLAGFTMGLVNKLSLNQTLSYAVAAGTATAASASIASLAEVNHLIKKVKLTKLENNGRF